ncbi:glycosyltransferase family 4 protein [Fictibacillus norfolkensis]|uniref:Glycosyltransferase family 1 protein n=1 Tax=Fictibacillus norfolkensis TaxID=2762233 RepID=A0ABR8SGW7_9BACL|nr:glycosyltransferase family 1 protein [Fictibacillus norfolkensis]MBD7962708.1 glycosyltransferase family 1 protein [Fictibacillus norfolkensis]
MKLALFSDTFHPQINGVARTLKRFTSYLETNGVEYKVIMPSFEEHQETECKQYYAMKSLPLFLYPECRLAIPQFKALNEELNKFRPDLLHIATPFNIGLFGMRYGKRENIPMVASYHTHFDRYLAYYHLDFLSHLLWRYLQWFHKPFEKIFVPSEETRKILYTKNFNNIEIWSRGVDCMMFTPQNRDYQVREKYNITQKYIFLFVGRLAPEKDLNILKEMIDKLPPSLSENVHWLIVGDGPCRRDVEQWETEYNHVTCAGYLSGDELARVYATADLFVFPSSTETFGNVVLEAAASGLPAIVSDSGGVAEIVQDGVTGRICKAREAESFIQNIVSIMEDPMLLSSMKLKARNYAMTQSWSAIFGNLLMQYEEVIYMKSKNKTIIA